MVTELDPLEPGSQKLLFLTNKQANLIRSSSNGVELLLIAFEMPAPKLIIRLQMSQGSISQYQVGYNKYFTKDNVPSWMKYFDPTPGASPPQPTDSRHLASMHFWCCIGLLF